MELADPLYIDTQQELLAWTALLAHADIVAVDTESDSLHHYREKVCLVQMTALGQDVIIDPLADLDLSVLGPMFADLKVTKIFHDAGYDLSCLGRDYGFTFASIFDTMLAARFLGCQEFGLAAILKARFGFIADKRFQRSDWARRPLSAEQISYARYDTHFLPALAAALSAELLERGRFAWAREDFARLPELASRTPRRPSGPDPDGFWRIKGVRSLSPEAKGRLRSLCLMRDRLAEKLDRPKFKVLGDSVLYELAENPPTTIEDLPRQGLRGPGVARFGADIMHALAQGTPVSGGPPQGATRRRRGGRFFDPEVRDRFEALRKVRRERALELGLDPEVVLGNALLEELARQPEVTASELRARPELAGWREPLFADALYDCLQA